MEEVPEQSSTISHGNHEPSSSQAPKPSRPKFQSAYSDIYFPAHIPRRPSGFVLKKTQTWAYQQEWVSPENHIELLEGSSSESDFDDDEDCVLDELEADDDAIHQTESTASARRQRRLREDPYAARTRRAELLSRRRKKQAHDGRLKISVRQTVNNGYLAKAVKASMRQHDRDEASQHRETASFRPRSDSVESVLRPEVIPPKLNIAIIVIGSRGDIQPFLKIGKILKSEYGHRVRIATHPHFKEFVEEDVGLEFFSVGGDPSELMAFMVKNPGLIPSIATIKSGEIGRRRSSMFEMFQGMWKACASGGDGDDGDDNGLPPFVADAIIANPPSFAHIHIAERLGIPLHIIFTFPYSPTTQFPHPLANIKQSNVEKGYTNFMSYPLVEMMTWQGLGDLVNKFRTKTLELDPVSTLWAPGMLYRLQVHHTYLWSPSLVKKPQDWGSEIDIAGFVFLNLGSRFRPPQALVDFLEAGPAPVYIGFGSIVVDDPNAFTDLIFRAVEQAGVRALVSKGWGGIGGGQLDVPENIFLLDNTPHDWLFPRCSAVVHHGGAGTTAIGLKCARPTMIVPFFGDQPFWGNMVAKARAGAFECIPYKNLTLEGFVTGIRQCLSDEAKENVAKIARKIELEGDGAANAVRSFHQALPLSGRGSLRCSVLENRVAVWRLKQTPFRFSAVAAELLVAKGKLKWKHLELFRSKEWNDFEGPGEPITGASTATVRGLADAAGGVGRVPVRAVKTMKKRHRHQQKKARHQQRLNEIKEEEAREAVQVEANETIEAYQAGPDQVVSSTGQPRPLRMRTQSSVLSADPTETLRSELANEARNGMRASAKAIVKIPMELPLAIAQGFHNAPRLYGDETVRSPQRISGFKSGLAAGKNEFGHGMSDAVTGLYRLPAKGVERSGFTGCLHGAAMSVGGLILKPLAALIAPWPYALKGIQMSWRQRNGEPGKKVWVKHARSVQGQKELDDLERMSGPKVTSGTTSSTNGLHCPEKVPETLADIEKRVEDGWRVVAKLLRIVEDADQRGFITRFKFERERKVWRANAALETVETAQVALDARERGESIEEALNKYRMEKEKKALGSGFLTTGMRHDSGPNGVVEPSSGIEVAAATKSGVAEEKINDDIPAHRTVDTNDFALKAIRGEVK